MLASLVSDYKEYSQKRNITFIGVCTSTTATVKSMQAQVKTFGLSPFANMLDAGGATGTAYGVPRNAKFQLVVIDGDSKIAYNAPGTYIWSSGPDNGKTIHSTQLEKSLAKYTGILGTDISVPKSMTYSAHLFDLQQFELMDKEMARMLTTSTNADEKRFVSDVHLRVTDHRKARLKQIEDLAENQPVQAYREAMSFVEAFPRAEEMPTVKAIGTKLIANAKVKQEIEAEAGYQRILVPEMKKVTTPAGWTKSIKPLLDGYLTAYGTTEYAAVVKNAVESHRLAVTNKAN